MTTQGNRPNRARFGIGLYLAMQVIIPLGGFLVGSPYFGWRMFSEVRFPPQVIVRRAGSVDTVAVTKYVGFPRGDMSYGPHVATQLCHLLTDVISVRLLPPSGTTQEVQCR